MQPRRLFTSAGTPACNFGRGRRETKPLTMIARRARRKTTVAEAGREQDVVAGGRERHEDFLQSERSALEITNFTPSTANGTLKPHWV